MGYQDELFQTKVVYSTDRVEYLYELEDAHKEGWHDREYTETMVGGVKLYLMNLERRADGLPPRLIVGKGATVRNMAPDQRKL